MKEYSIDYWETDFQMNDKSDNNGRGIRNKEAKGNSRGFLK
jgi:hypothetical protein